MEKYNEIKPVSSINVPAAIYNAYKKQQVFTVVLRWYNRYDTRNRLGVNVTYKVRLSEIGRFFSLIQDRKIPYSDLSITGISNMINALCSLTDVYESPRYKTLILSDFGLEVLSFEVDKGKKKD